MKVENLLNQPTWMLEAIRQKNERITLPLCCSVPRVFECFQDKILAEEYFNMDTTKYQDN